MQTRREPFRTGSSDFVETNTKGHYTWKEPSTSRHPSDATEGLFTAGSKNIANPATGVKDGSVVGLFTSRYLPEGTPVAAYHGVTMKKELYDQTPVNERILPYVHDVDMGTIRVIVLPLNGIDPYHPYSCTAAWANEAPFGLENNMRMRLLKVTIDGTPHECMYQCQLTTTRPVMEGEELLWHYGSKHDRRGWYPSTEIEADALAGNSRVSGNYSTFEKFIDHSVFKATRGDNYVLRRRDLKLDLVTLNPQPLSFFSYSKSCPHNVITTMEELYDRVGSVRWW